MGEARRERQGMVGRQEGLEGGRGMRQARGRRERRDGQRKRAGTNREVWGLGESSNSTQVEGISSNPIVVEKNAAICREAQSLEW